MCIYTYIYIYVRVSDNNNNDIYIMVYHIVSYRIVSYHEGEGQHALLGNRGRAPGQEELVGVLASPEAQGHFK